MPLWRQSRPVFRLETGLEARRERRSEVPPLPGVEKRLGYSPDGLSEVEARKRPAQCDPNETEEKKANPFLKFLPYCRRPI